MLSEPADRFQDNLVERSPLFEQMTGSRHHMHFNGTPHALHGPAVELEHLLVLASDQQQGGRLDQWEGVAG